MNNELKKFITNYKKSRVQSIQKGISFHELAIWKNVSTIFIRQNTILIAYNIKTLKPTKIIYSHTILNEEQIDAKTLKLIENHIIQHCNKHNIFEIAKNEMKLNTFNKIIEYLLYIDESTIPQIDKLIYNFKNSNITRYITNTDFHMCKYDNTINIVNDTLSISYDIKTLTPNEIIYDGKVYNENVMTNFKLIKFAEKNITDYATKHNQFYHANTNFLLNTPFTFESRNELIKLKINYIKNIISKGLTRND